jgi:hypothetical protein
MAEENLFNPLDDLGPEFGGINRPGSDANSYLPFEGDKIDTPKINFPQAPNPFSMPGVRDLTRPNFNIKQNIVNNPGIIKSAPKPGKVDVKGLMNAQQDYLKSLIQSKQSNEDYARIYSYNAGPSGGAFYDRYAAYGQETFDKIGFHPLRDNEAIFNARTTKADDWSRMMSHSFLPMVWKGFTDGPKSLWKMIQGDFTGTDLEGAEEYERLAAIGSSSKGGAFGFVNNTVMNFGYTAGIITEAIVEEVAGLALAPLTGGTSAAVTTANNARKIPSLFRGIKGFDAAYDASKAVGNTLKALNNSQSARKFWNAANAAGTSKIGRFLNPLENTVDAITGIRATDNLTGFAKTFRTAGGFYRDVRNLNMALSEARLEAGMVENKVYKDGYNAHYEKFGTAPTNDVQEKLMSTAKQASLDTLYWNTGLIYASNKITFNNITGPRGGIRNFVRANIDDVMKAGNGKFGTVGKIVYDNTKKQFARQSNDFMSWAKGWAKDPIYKSVGKTVGYFKSNFTEGLQENAQEIIAGANEKYYTDAFKSSVLKMNLYSRGVTGYANKTKFDYYEDEFGKQFTEQGAETFASGFLMGTLAAPLNSAVPMLSVGYNRLFNNTEYQEYKARKEEMLNGIVNNLNSLGPKQFYDSRIFNTAVQDMAADIKNTGSKKQAYDATDEAFISQVTTAMETGSLYLFRERMTDMKKMTPEEIEKEVPGVEKGEGQKYLNRLDDIINRIDTVEKRYNYYKERYPNPISPDTLNEKDPEFNAKVQLYTGWNVALRNAVFFNEAFESAIKRKAGIKNKLTANKPFASISDTEVNSLLDNLVLGKEISNIRNEIKSLEDLKKSGTLDPELNKELENKKKKLEAYTELFNETETFNNFFNRYENLELIKKSMKKELEKRNIKTDELTDEAVIAAIDKNLGAFDDVNKAERIQAYKRSVDKYLKSIADVSNDNVFDEKLDDLFNDLLDHQKLDTESKKLVRYNNLLHNPEEFLKLVERNTEWLKSLYDNRENIFRDIVTEQIGIVEANSLLNALADRGIYMSVDDFAEFIKNGTKPKEFFNEPANEVYQEGTTEYDEIFEEYLTKFNALRPEKPVSQEEDELFGQDLDLEMIFEDEETTQKTKEELYKSYTPEQKASIKKIEELIKLQENVKAGETLKVDDPVTGLKAGEKAYLINDLFHRRVTNAIKDVEASDYQYTDKAVLEDIFQIAFGGNVLKENTGAEDFTFKGKNYVKDLVPTEGGYNIKVSEKLEDGTIKPLSETESSILGFVYLAKQADLAGFRDVLYEELADELTNILQPTTTPVSTTTDTKADIERKKEETIASIKEGYNGGKTWEYIGQFSSQATKFTNYELFQNEYTKDQVIDEINAKYDSEPTALEEAPVSTEAPRTGFRTFAVPISKKENIADVVAGPLVPASEIFWDKNIKTTGSWLNSVQGEASRGKDYIEIAIDSLSEENRKIADELKESDNEYSPVKGARIVLGINLTPEQAQRKSIEIANKFKQQDLLWYSPRTLQNTIDVLEKDKQRSSTPEAYDQEIQRVKDTWGKDLRQDEYFDEATKTIWASKELYDKSKGLTTAEQTTSTQPVNISNEDLYNKIYKFVSEKTYEDGREAGNYVDQAAKDFLGEGKMPEFDPNKITKKAYLDLFGPDGHLTQIKRRIDNGELYIVAKGLVVYDSNIEKLDGTTDRIAGEIDLIAVDRKGKIHIIDIKTGNEDKWLKFNRIKKTKKTATTKDDGIYSKRENYTLQQATYATLLKRMIGVDASISLLPVQRSSDPQTGKILTAGKPTAQGIYQPLIYRRTPDGKISKNSIGIKEFEIEDSAQVSEMLIPLYIASVRDEMNTLFPITRYKDATGEYVEEMIDLSGVSKTVSPKDKLNTLTKKYENSTKKIDSQIETIQERLSKFNITQNFDSIDLSENSDFVQQQLEKDEAFANVFKVHKDRFVGKVSYAPTPGQLLAIDALSTGVLTPEEIDLVQNGNPNREEVSEIIHEAVKRIQYLKVNTTSDVAARAFSDYQRDVFSLISLNNTNAQDKAILETFVNASQATTPQEIQDAVNSLDTLQSSLEQQLSNRYLKDNVIQKIQGQLKDVKDFNANFRLDSGFVDVVDIFADPIDSTIDGESVVKVNDIYYLNKDGNPKMVVTEILENGNIVLKLATKQNTPRKNAKEMVVSPNEFSNNFVKESELNNVSDKQTTYTTSPAEKEILEETFDAQDVFLASDEAKQEAYNIGMETNVEDIKNDLINKFKNCQ